MPNGDSRTQTIGSGGARIPTASPPSTASTPPPSTSRSPSTAPKCSARADPLAAIQQVHWQIHRAFIAYQTVAEERRQLAAEIGELVRQLVDALLTAGWTEEQARNTNVHELATHKPATHRRN